MSDTPLPNPAEATQGAIPVGGASASFSTGLPDDFVSPTGEFPYLQKNPQTGQITSRFYDIRNDPRVILNGIDPKERQTILEGIATKIPGYDPGTGYGDKDYQAFGDLLAYANLTGLPYFAAYRDFMQKVPASSYSKKAPSVRVTSADDLKVVFRKASTDLLGYEIDDATAQKFAQSYRQMEIAEGQKQAAGGVYESAAAPSTVAEQQILQQFQPEAQSFATGNLASIMDARIKALGA